MGGEPTFVGIDEPESPQWNIDALGPMKANSRFGAYPDASARRWLLAGCFITDKANGIPASRLPRWALSCAWRADGVPVWENIELIAREDEEHNFGTVDASEVYEALTRRLQVSRRKCVACITTASRANQPDTSCPFAAAKRRGQLYWSSQFWFPRPERLLLSPGDSPIGYRIPTDSMPWVAPDELEYEHEACAIRATGSSSLHSRSGDWTSLIRIPRPIRCPLSRALRKRRRS